MVFRPAFIDLVNKNNQCPANNEHHRHKEKHIGIKCCIGVVQLQKIVTVNVQYVTFVDGKNKIIERIDHPKDQ
jgi:hypothetical protein